MSQATVDDKGSKGFCVLIPDLSSRPRATDSSIALDAAVIIAHSSFDAAAWRNSPAKMINDMLPLRDLHCSARSLCRFMLLPEAAVGL